VAFSHEQLTSPAEQPDAAIMAKEEIKRKFQALERLNETDRWLIQWRRLDDLSYTEIAQLLNIEEAAARQRFARAEARWIQEIRRASEAT
jgi:RNA polymerase sigma factor (sigma-70 family)